ncbi:MAG: glycosyltransferase [Porticoccaceae bacterium]|nr:glycosyltransferase [Porticoccaceae bacterium]
MMGPEALERNEIRSPKVSCAVIATVRNEAENIGPFVESLLQQSRPPDEIIIVDGESSDGTNERLQAYASGAQITLITQNCNIAQGRNIAIAAATSEIIASTDAGCVIDKHWLERITQPFFTASAPDVVAGNYSFDCQSNFEEAVVLATNAPDRTRSEEANYYPSSRSVAFTKAIWEKAKGYPEWLYAAEDTLFNIRLRQIGGVFTFAENALVKWRPRSSWRAVGKQFFNYARGNGRIGFASQGYKMNIKYHTMMLVPILASVIYPWLCLLSIYPIYVHIRHNLWPQAHRSSKSSDTSCSAYRILLIMEYVRLVGMFGYARGRIDRLLQPSFRKNQVAWMGVESVEK